MRQKHTSQISIQEQRVLYGIPRGGEDKEMSQKHKSKISTNNKGYCAIYKNRARPYDQDREDDPLCPHPACRAEDLTQDIPCSFHLVRSFLGYHPLCLLWIFVNYIQLVDNDAFNKQKELRKDSMLGFLKPSFNL